jgi:hypothetical protein
VRSRRGLWCMRCALARSDPAAAAQQLLVRSSSRAQELGHVRPCVLFSLGSRFSAMHQALPKHSWQWLLGLEAIFLLSRRTGLWPLPQQPPCRGHKVTIKRWPQTLIRALIHTPPALVPVYPSAMFGSRLLPGMGGGCPFKHMSLSQVSSVGSPMHVI